MMEPNWYSVSGLYPRPRSKRIFIHRPLDRTIVEVRPDLTLLIRDALGRFGTIRRGYGFALANSAEERPQLIDFRKVEQSLVAADVPAVRLSCRGESIGCRLTALTTDGTDGNGRVHMYAEVSNLHPTLAKRVYVHVLAVDNDHDAFYRHTNEDYIPFETVEAAWHQGLIESVQGNVNEHGSWINEWLAADEQGREIVRVAADSEGIELAADGEGVIGPFANALRFAVTLAPGQSKRLLLQAPYPDGLSQPGASPSIGSQQGEDGFVLDEAAALTACGQLWSEALQGGMTVNLPERIVQDVFDTVKTNQLQMMAELPDGSQIIPGQGGFNDHANVYSWEASAYLRTLDRTGYGHLTERALQYFLSTQEGSIGPEGEIRSAEGSFRAKIHWMSETGSVLGMVANHYWLTHDRDWFVSVLEQVLKALAWVAGEREGTKQSAYSAAGEKLRHYGLLSAGRPHDWPHRGYFLFSDSITWYGCYWIARALADIKHPEAARWMAEAEDYRSCILHAVEQATHLYPQEERLRWIANEVYAEPESDIGIYPVDGPINLLEYGLLDPNDTRVAELEHFMRVTGKMTDLFACKMERMEDRELGELQKQYAGGDVDLYYVNVSERIWHRVWSMQGKREQALRYFYATLAYSTTLDTHHCHERFCPQLPWMSPWQPNGSGNGRLIEIICNSLYLLDENELHLLPCIPRDWLDIGKKVEVGGARTNSGLLSFAVTRHAADRLELTALLPGRITKCKLTLELASPYVVAEAKQLDQSDADIGRSLRVETNSVSFELQAGDTDRELRFCIGLAVMS